ncbi:MAG: PhzF family phenazine biosynthesis protein [Coriobacteriia bacterium]
MSRTYRFVIVDVFTDVPFTGNQLGVFTNAEGLSGEQMQALAQELGFSETTFVLRPEADGDIRMRIFTPVREIPFAGHPTLGTAFVIAGPLQKVLLRIETDAGIVPVVLEREGARIVFGRMEQPLPTVRAVEDPRRLLDALGMRESPLPVERYDNGPQHLLVALGSSAEVTALRPDMQRLAGAAGDATVSCFSWSGPAVKARVFAPGLGAGEDAATGSAAGPLAVHLARHGQIEWGQEIEISQGTEIGRPSVLWATAEGEPGQVRRVEVGGAAVVVARGEFTV